VDRADLNRINSSSHEAVKNNPFAAFFKPGDEEGQSK
jgi:hypothetical protein